MVEAVHPGLWLEVDGGGTLRQNRSKLIEAVMRLSAHFSRTNGLNLPKHIESVSKDLNLIYLSCLFRENKIKKERFRMLVKQIYVSFFSSSIFLYLSIQSSNILFFYPVFYPFTE